MLPVATADSEQLLEITAYNRTEEFVARFFGIDSETIRGWRKRGQGPKYKKINGKLIRYSLADLTAWAESQPGRRGPTLALTTTTGHRCLATEIRCTE